MKKNILATTFLLVTLALVFSGCGNKPEPTPTVDPVAIMTEVAGTVQAQVTQNAMLTPSATVPPPPAPTLPPAPTQALPIAPTTPASIAPTFPAGISPDNAVYVADITVPDGTVFWKGEKFTKTWQIKNTGTTTWDANYRLVYKDGTITSEELVFNLINPVEPGKLLNISVKMAAPNVIGSYTNYWQMMNGNGQFFGEVLSMQIKVGTELDKTPTPSG
jgi:hypothetical protein